MSHRILRPTIHPTAFIAPNVQVGKDVVIGPHASIGWDGFGYYRTEDGWERKPQSYGVILEDGVHIGANTCIDRGSYTNTVIGEGTKVDNLVHIAHNVQIGKRCMVIAQAMLAGSVELGDDCWIAPHAVIREHVRIGNGAFVALGAVVTEDVPDCTSVRGVPAKPFQPRESPIAIPASS